MNGDLRGAFRLSAGGRVAKSDFTDFFSHALSRGKGGLERSNSTVMLMVPLTLVIKNHNIMSKIDIKQSLTYTVKY